MAISKNLLNEGETLVVDTRTHPKALLFPLLMLVVLLAIGTAVQTQVDQKEVDLVVWGLVVIGAIWFVPPPVPDLADRVLHDHHPTPDHPARRDHPAGPRHPAHPDQ